jgi:NitT/TauT family transport system ATP-binding protein
MDEPFGALDEITRKRLQLQRLELQRAERKTVIFVTHNIDEAAFLSSRVMVMSARPGSIHAEIAIDAPQPRTDAFRTTDTYVRACARLSETLAAASGEAFA